MSKHDRRAYHRVADQVLHEPWDNDLLAFVTRLQAALHERWRTGQLTAEEACRVRLGHSELCKIAGKGRFDVALKSARRAAEVASMSASLDGDIVEIFWPKWSEFQGLTGAFSRQSESASRVPRPAPEKKRDSAPSGARQQRPPKTIRTPAPEALSEEQREALRAWCRSRHPDLIGRLLRLEEACLGHHRGRGNRMADWVAAVQTWVRNEAEGRFSPARPSGPPKLAHVGPARLTAADFEIVREAKIVQPG